jgi:hypothetical protein
MNTVMNTQGPETTPPTMLAGRDVWIISDGKAGHELQMLGVTEALGATPVIKRIPEPGRLLADRRVRRVRAAPAVHSARRGPHWRWRRDG